MGYWKRQYTERPTGKPLFRPDPRSVESRTPDTPDPAESDASVGAQPEQPERQSAETPSQ
jgi:hypothetical protein